MVLPNIAKSHQQTRDSIGSEPTILDIHKVRQCNIFMEQGPTQEKQQTEGHSFILGSSTNGILGTNTGTEDGQQQTLGDTTVTTVVRVLNVGNKYVERFSFDNFKDTSITTATWSNDGVLSWYGARTKP